MCLNEKSIMRSKKQCPTSFQSLLPYGPSQVQQTKDLDIRVDIEEMYLTKYVTMGVP